MNLSLVSFSTLFGLALATSAMAQPATPASPPPSPSAGAPGVAEPVPPPAPTTDAAEPPSSPAGEEPDARPAAPPEGASQTPEAPAFGSWPGVPRPPNDGRRHTLPAAGGLPDERAEPEPPRPGLHESRFQLQLGLETQWRSHPSFDFFSEDDATGLGGIAAGYAVLSTPDWALVPELGWGRTDLSRDSLFGGGLETTWLSDRFHAGVSLRYALASFFEPHARLAAGVDWARLSVTAPNTPELVQEDVVAFGSIGAGATFHTNPGGLSRRGLTRTLLLGITVEGGYALSPDLTVKPKPDGKAPRVSTSDTSFGSLSGSGAYFRFAATFRL